MRCIPMSCKKNKICIIEPVGGHGGLEVYDFGVCYALYKNDFDVVLYTCDKTKYHNIESMFTVNRFFKSIYGNISLFSKMKNFLKGLYLTYRDLKIQKANIVYLHVFTFSAVELSLLLMSTLFEAKLVVNIHDPISFGNKGSGFIKQVFNRVIRSSKIVVTTHTDYSRKVLHQVFPNLEVALMPHSDVDLLYDTSISKTESKNVLGLDQDLRYVLFFGQIKATKGLETLLSSWAAVASQYHDLRLLIVGRCWQNDCQRYNKIINDEDISGTVQWKEMYIDDVDVPSYFKAAELVVLPYTRIYSSGVLLRAIGYGAPLMVSDQDAFTGIVEHNHSAVVFKTANPGDLSEKLREIIDHPALLGELSHNAKVMLDKKHSWDIVGQEMNQIFMRIINDRK